MADVQDLFPSKWRHVEEKGGVLMSFFYSEESHVVTRRKEALMERPHGSILAGNVCTESMRASTQYIHFLPVCYHADAP